MTNDHHAHDTEPRTQQRHDPGHSGHSGHSWMMIACCIPMILIAVALVGTGVVSPGFLVVAVACTAMMALMMKGMDHGEGDDSTHAGHGRGDR